MKKVYIVLILNTIVLMACQKKSLPTVSTRSVEPPAPAPVLTNYAPDTARGKSLFAARCARCHGLPDINLYNAKRWDGILASMIPRARLSAEQGADVTAYIKINCPK